MKSLFLPLISPVEYMINGTFKFNARFAGHEFVLYSSPLPIP